MKSSIQKYCLLFFVIFLFHQLSAQTPYYYKINEENGLPSSEVYQIIQDDFGYIWVGCDAGLYRYDGIRFKSFSCKKQNSKSISGLKIDKDKSLWCQNFSGQIFRVNSDSLDLVIDVSNKIKSYSQYTIDQENHIWIANDGAIELYDFKGKLIHSFSVQNSKKDTIHWKEIEANSSGQLFLASERSEIGFVKKEGSEYHVIFLDTTSSKLQRTTFEPYSNNLVALKELNATREYIISIVNDKSIIEKNRLLPFSKDGLIYKVYKDNVNRHWLCTSSGIVKLNKDLKLDNESKFFFTNDKISGIFQDREGNLWVSSLQNGIYVIPNYELSLYDEQSSVLKDHNITALLKTSKNELLVGTYTGLVYKLNQNNVFELLPQQTLIPYRTVKKMEEYNSKLYVAHGPLSSYENNKETLFKSFNIRDFCWMGDTLFYVNSSMCGYLTSFHDIRSDEFGKSFIKIHNKGCRAIALDKITNTIYFASIDGLFSFCNGKTNEIKITEKSIFANKLLFKDGRLWVGTVNEGLYALKNNSIIHHYYNNHLLQGNSVKSFKIFDNSIFVATEEGLTKINFKINESEFYNYTDGVVSKEINDIECWNETVFLATNKGLLKLPNQTLNNSIYPNIEITSIEINKIAINKNEILNNLSYDKNNISIYFNSACLKARGDFKYKFRLLGFDTDWHYNTATNNEIHYVSLPSGDFTFEVRAVNEDGLESLKTEQVKFCIYPPFWQRWWFYVLMILLGSGIVTVLFLIRIRFIKRRAELRNKVTASQLTALKSQMNPHFLFNTLNSLQDLILKHDIKNSNYYLNKFSLLMREILDTSGKDEINLTREIKLLDTYLELEKLRFGDEFKFSINIDDDIDADHLLLPPMIIQPFIENALKHGLLHKKGDKILNINFHQIENVLTCEIIDNGVGRKRSEEIKLRNARVHQSFATEATDRRMDLLNSFNDKKYSFQIIDLYEGDISLGTKVIVSIPV